MPNKNKLPFQMSTLHLNNNAAPVFIQNLQPDDPSITDRMFDLVVVGKPFYGTLITTINEGEDVSQMKGSVSIASITQGHFFNDLVEKPPIKTYQTTTSVIIQPGTYINQKMSLQFPADSDPSNYDDVTVYGKISVEMLDENHNRVFLLEDTYSKYYPSLN